MSYKAFFIGVVFPAGTQAAGSNNQRRQTACVVKAWGRLPGDTNTPQESTA